MILIKRIKEKQNLQIKENLKNIYKDYEILGNDYSNSRVIKMFNRIQNEKILSTYLNIFNEINNETFDLPDFNKNKTSKENIKNITKNLYEKHFNDFKKKYAKFENYIDEKNNETINKIENEIDNILKKIKNVIENSLNEVQNINLNGQYLKRHILNFCDNKIYLKLSNNYTIDKIIDNHVILENIKYIEDNIYSNKITDILNENFKLSLNDYFENYYKYEVVNYITWIYEYYYKNMMIYTDNLVKNKTNYLCMMIKNSKKLKLDNYTYEQIINLHNELEDIFFENTIKIDDTLYSDNEFMRNKHILIKTYLNIVGNNDFLRSLSLTDNYKNLFKYNDTIYELLENYTNITIEPYSRDLIDLFTPYNYYDIASSEMWYGNLLSIKNNLTEILKTSSILIKQEEIYNKHNFTNLFKLIEKLENQCKDLEIKQILLIDDNIIEPIVEEFSNITKFISIEEVVNKFENFSNSFGKKLNTIIEDDFIGIKKIKNIYNSTIEYINQAETVINNYINSFIGEVEHYYEKLIIFGFIDGLNVIPVEYAEELRSIWDFASNTIFRGLEGKKQPVNI